MEFLPPPEQVHANLDQMEAAEKQRFRAAVKEAIDRAWPKIAWSRIDGKLTGKAQLISHSKCAHPWDLMKEALLSECRRRAPDYNVSIVDGVCADCTPSYVVCVESK